MNPYSLVGLRNSGTFLPYPQVLRAREGLLPIDAKFLPHDSSSVWSRPLRPEIRLRFLLAPKFT